MRKLFSIIAAILFAGSMMAAVQEFSVTITKSDFNKTSYAANNNEKTSTAIATADATVTMDVKWTSNQMMLKSDESCVQSQKTNGALYNAASWGTVKSVTIDGGSNVSYTIGAAAQPTTSAEGGFFQVKNNSSATGYFNSITIVFEADPSVASLTANDVALGEVLCEPDGLFTKDVTIEVEAANLSDDIAFTTTSSKLAFVTTGDLPAAGGDLVVTVTAGAGVELNEAIVLTSGELTHTVYVTGKVFEKYYTPGAEVVTFDAGPQYAQGGDSTFVNGQKAVKVGTTNNAGTAIIHVPANATKLYFLAAAWANKACTVTLSAEGITMDKTSVDLLADAGIANNSPFFTKKGDLSVYEVVIELSGVTANTDITLTATGSNKRFVIWDVTADVAAPVPTTYAITVDNAIEGGSVSADKEEAAEGETVTLTATPDANYVFGAWNVKDADNADVTVTNNQFTMPAKAVTVSAVFQPVAPVGCDWDNLPFFNTGLPDTDENYNQFKICKEGEQPNVINIQTASWADNHKGIYASYPSAVFGAINIDAANYTIQGAGILFHLDAFTANETEVSVVCDNVEMVFTVLNTKAITPVVPIEITIDENVDLMDDLASTGGFWLLAAQNDDFTVVIGNANAVTELAGTYTVADLDAESYIKTATDSISFVDGSITVEELAGGIHFRGTIEGNDGEFYLLSISKALVGPTVVDVVAASPDDYVRWTDAVASRGWWQIYGEGAEFGFSLSNTDTDDPEGTYGIADLDPNWCYVVDLSNTADTITFSDGEVVVAIDAEGVVTVTGELLGSDGKTYAFDLTYQDPTAETTVNVTIAEGELDDTYLESAGLFGLAGVDATNNITAQFYIWTEDGMAGDYTEEDLDNYYYGSGIMVGTTVQEIFSATLHVAVDDNNQVVLTADVLCYNNTLYKVTLTVPGETPQPTYAVTFAQPQNGTLVVKNEGVAIASGDEFEAGVVLTVEATPADGFVLSTLTAGGVDIIDAKRFTIVDAAVEVVATFVVDPAAGINNVDANQRRIKAIENGQLFINVNGVRYNVNGARVK